MLEAFSFSKNLSESSTSITNSLKKFSFKVFIPLPLSILERACARFAEITPVSLKPFSPKRLKYRVVERAIRDWFEQILLVAFSLLICCSLVWIVSVKACSPSASTVLPTSLPGICRIKHSLHAMYPA